MLVGIYLRVSTQEQAKEGYSLGEQEERLKAYCMAKRWTISNIYSDGGFSGSNTHRPALQKLINDINRKKIDTVLVYKLDRLSRSQKDTLEIIEDIFLKNNINFISLNENFDTSTPFGKAMIGILSVFAQLEREQIKERMFLGHVGRAKEGYFHGGGYSPIGYDYENGELHINEYEAMQVRKIYDLFLKGYPVARIRKIMATSYAHKYGKWKSDSSIKSCLTSPIYYGIVSYGGEKYNGRHTPIVSKELYDKVQERFKELDNNKKDDNKTPFKHTQLLGGLIFCGNCGARYFSHYMAARKNSKVEGGYTYYSCYSRVKANRRMVKDPNCKNKNWSVKETNALVIDEILKLQFDESYLEELYNSNNERDNPDDNISVIEKRIEELSNQLDKIMDLYQLGNIPLDKISERVQTLTTERNNLESELFDLKDNISKFDTKKSLVEAKEIVKNAKCILESDNMDNKRMLVHSLVERVVLYDNHIKIYWNF